MAGGGRVDQVTVEISTDLPCAAALVLAPDDVEMPEGFSISHICRDNRYVVVIGGNDVLTLKNTVDDVLRCLKVVDALWRELADR
ncbi:MAG: KEOPS complex subunit Pcc1 [Thermoproteus sp.]|jgi:tRNA threonylcarbamoyladenosine modification (KEOPS) complex  Pcc1 subunit